MPKSKNRKNHKAKVNSRNTELKNRKTSTLKKQKQFIEDLIKQEQEKGSFENTLSVDNNTIDGPII